MAGLTDAQKRAYLDASGLICPYCGSENIHALEVLDGDYNQAWRRVACSECDEEWRDIYTLTDVEEVD